MSLFVCFSPPFSGYSGLVLDSTGSNLISNCTDDNIYMFNVSGMKTSPGIHAQMHVVYHYDYYLCVVHIMFSVWFFIK